MTVMPQRGRGEIPPIGREVRGRAANQVKDEVVNRERGQWPKTRLWRSFIFKGKVT